MLAQLTATKEAQTPSEAVESLRLWKRQVKRAHELQALLPDPVLQVRALLTIMNQLLNQDAQASFRVSAYRMENGIDTAPTQEEASLFYDLLLAEAELMVTSKDCVMVADGEDKMPAIKAMQESPARPPRSEVICHWWGSEGGCRAGKSCKFQHDWNSLPDKANRCWVCSSSQHRKSDCPSSSAKMSPLPYATGGSATPQEGKSYEKGGKGKKGKGKGKHKGQGQGQITSPTKEGGEAKEAKGTEKSSAPAVKAEKVTEEREEWSSKSGSTSEELVSEVTSLLKSLRVQGPQIKVCQVNKVQASGEEGTLLDGGATHCLRTRKIEEEWKEVDEVVVKLAAGEMKMRQCRKTKTLLVKEDVQPIIPVAKIAEVGYSIWWTREACCIEHPKHGKIPVVMNQGCPIVNNSWGEKMMQEVEEAEEKKVRMRAVMFCGMLAENEYEKELAELHTTFPEVQMRLLERIPGDQEWDPTQVPFNRRIKKKVKRAKALVVNMCSSPNTKRWRELEQEGVLIINVESILGVNALDPQVSGWLEEEVIKSGKVVTWTAGPPCRTVSLCRMRSDKDGGPPQLRERHGEGRFGREHLNSAQQEMVDHDTALWVKNLWYMKKTRPFNPQVEFVVEQPQDPKDWCSWGQDCPTFLNWKETREICQALGLCEIKLCQGGLGHSIAKPSTLLTDAKEIMELEGVKSQGNQGGWPETLAARLEKSKALAEWAPGLVFTMKEMMKRKIEGALHPPKVAVLNAKEKEAKRLWQMHAEANHFPYRKDCGICVETMGKDRPHRRQKRPEPFTLALDVAGPFITRVDQPILGGASQHKPKYFLIATTTIPMLDGKPMVEGLRALGHDGTMESVPQIPELKEGDKMEREQGGEEYQAPEGDHQEQEDPFKELEEGMESKEELSQARVKELDEQDAKWRTFMMEVEKLPVKTFTLAVPIQSKKSKDVIRATAQIMARFRALRIPINRVHTDRGQEFCGREFKKWLEARELYHTTTAGNEPASNSRAENEIKIMKARARLLMRSAKCELNKWPLAVRFASEERFRNQLNECGIPTPALLPFGVKAYARQKTWQNRSCAWRNPMVPVRVWGPAWDMSMTSKGYFLEILSNGRMMRSTVVVIPKDAPAIAD